MSTEQKPLFEGIVVLTGEPGSGKTLACLKNEYPEDRTLLYDLEQGAAYYEQLGAFHRVDLIDRVTSEHGDKWTDLQLYLMWLDHARSIEPGQYDVIAIDPAERIEAGLTEWIEKNPGLYGRTAAQYQSMSGIKWGDMKNHWSKHMLDLADKCKMLIITFHMRDEWKAKQPTGKRIRGGKENLTKLATLELVLVRKPKQVVPSAYVKKSRLVFGTLADPRPMFDPWIEEFTWAKVSEYLQHGADPNNLQQPPAPDPEEKRQEELRLKAQIAEDERLTAEARAAQAAARAERQGSSNGREVCPICKATAPADSDKGHAPWCQLQPDGTRLKVKT